MGLALYAFYSPVRDTDAIETIVGTGMQIYIKYHLNEIHSCSRFEISNNAAKREAEAQTNQWLVG